MEHLSRETLARLVDEAPSEAERAHLDGCAPCRTELEGLRAQTEELGSLPELRPPLGDWAVLEARMRSEGLLRPQARFDRTGLARTPGWMRAAAAVMLFLGGTATGAFLDDGPAGGGRVTDAGAAGAARYAAGAVSLEEAAGAVRLAEQNYVTALTRYRQLLAEEDAPGEVADPASRFAALEYLVAAGQAAVRQAPADPFLNGLLASTLAERDATLRTISSTQDGWF